MDNQNLTPTPGGGNNDYVSIDRFLDNATTALINAQTPEITPLLEARGYSTGDIKAKLEELDKLRTLNQKQLAEYGEQYKATEAFKKGRAGVHEDYMDHVKLCRVVFKNDTAARTGLGLRGGRAQSQSGYIGQGLTFYENALASDEHQAAMAKKGISKSDLEKGQAAFKNLQTLTAAQQKETGEAQEATKRRDAAYDAATDWMSDFYETAKVALRKYPQLMEQMGIKEVS